MPRYVGRMSRFLIFALYAITRAHGRRVMRIYEPFHNDDYTPHRGLHARIVYASRQTYDRTYCFSHWRVTALYGECRAPLAIIWGDNEFAFHIINVKLAYCKRPIVCSRCAFAIVFCMYRIPEPNPSIGRAGCHDIPTNLHAMILSHSIDIFIFNS